MSNYEELLINIETKLKDNNINKKNIKNYMYIYSLELQDLEKLLSSNWDNEIILSKLIKVLSTDDEYKDKKIELLEKISSNTDIKYDKEKIISLTSIINNTNSFGENTDLLNTIIDKGLNSKTKEGTIATSKITKNIIEYLSEDENIFIDRNTIIRLVEIISFITKTSDIYKVEAASNIVNNYPKNKIGNMCGLIAIMNKSNNKNQAQMIVDIAKNEGLRQYNLELNAAEKAVRTDISGLEGISEILSYSDIVTEEDLKDDINTIKENKIKVKQRI